MSLKTKVAMLAGGNSATSISIARVLLKEHATIVVPAKSAHELLWVKEIAEAEEGSLITFLADYPDFYKAMEILDDIKERCGNIDISIVCFESPGKTGRLIDLDITEWERMIEQNITAFFVAVRLAYEMTRESKQAMLITIDTTPLHANKAGAKLDHLSKYIQKELAGIFYEETKNTGLTYRHLYVTETTKPDNRYEDDNFVPLEELGTFIIKLYNDSVNTGTVK